MSSLSGRSNVRVRVVWGNCYCKAALRRKRLRVVVDPDGVLPVLVPAHAHAEVGEPAEDYLRAAITTL